MDALKFNELSYPGDYFNHNLTIPASRHSAEEEYWLKTAALGETALEAATAVYSLPIKVPAHHFIYDEQVIKRYQNYPLKDEKDP